MKALVTGGTGFVGGHLIEALRRAGHEVTALVRNAGKGATLAERGVRLVAGDLHATRALAEAAEGQDLVFHVAGATSALDEAGFHRANVEGTRHVVDAATAARVGRLVHVSSLAAAGPSEPGRPLRGDEPPRPVTAYGRSKLAAEEAVRAGRVEWAIVRPPMVYGPGDREFLRAFRAAHRFGVSPVFGSGAQELVAVYAPDLADALVAVAVAGSTAGRTYAACHAERFTQLELARKLGEAVGRAVTVPRLPGALARPVLFVAETAARLTGQPTLLTTDKANEFFAPAWTADPSPIARDADWEAAHDLDAGLRRTAAWYRERGWL
jgi:nucleoside-diphosphate-sugar epimerase